MSTEDNITYLDVFNLIEAGAEATDVHSATCDLISQQPETACLSIYIPAPYDNTVLTEQCFFNRSVLPLLESDSYQLIETRAGLVRKSLNSCCYFFPTISLGIISGGIAIETHKEADQSFLELCTIFSRIIGHITEHQSLSKRLQHFIDRLQILNNLHQLIASNVSLTRIVRSVIHEAAFRFGADLGLVYVTSNDDEETLELKGGYGCRPEGLPEKISRYKGLIGRTLMAGSHLAALNIQNQNDHDLDFLQSYNICGVDISCLEVRGDQLGIILLGFKKKTTLSSEEIGRFEELSRMAAVAISNARNQEKIRSYTDRLEELVRERTLDLTIQTEKAHEANRAKSRFLANMSHELRTPLTAIVGYSSILVDGLFGELNEKQKDALQAITKSSQHLKNLIDDVLNLAKIESGKEEPEPTQVPLEDLLTHSFRLIQQQAVEKGLNFALPTLGDDLKGSSLFADQKHIHQILINLLSNAVKYTPTGGRVWMIIEDHRDHIVIKVCDTGVGVPPLRQHKLFERFERGEDAYSKQQEGTGIGLNLTKKLVQLNNGSIGFESEPGKGSIFWVAMPKATVEATLESITNQTEQRSNLRLDGLYGIVVEDNDVTRELLRIILQGAGATTKEFPSVGLAISELKSGKEPDFILTDLSMPETSGLDLINWSRSQPAFPKELPIIVLSACAFEEDRDAAQEAGASLFLAKPFRPSEVLSAIRSLTISAAMRKQRRL